MTTRAEIEALIKRLEERARGFDARAGSIYTGDIVAAELRWTARELRARLSSMKDDANG